jgi:hypothetical protein
VEERARGGLHQGTYRRAGYQQEEKRSYHRGTETVHPQHQVQDDTKSLLIVPHKEQNPSAPKTRIVRQKSKSQETIHEVMQKERLRQEQTFQS